MATLAGLLLVALSGGLIYSQWRSRGQIVDSGQFRRRILTSALMGLLGLAIITGQFILAAITPIAFVLFWLAVLALAGLLGMSGLLDLLLTRSKTRRQLADQQLELRRLQGELAKAEARRRELVHQENGKSQA